jgi:hypothetical protein
VRARAGDLLKTVRLEMNDDGPNVQVELSREPTQQEIEHLNRVINQVLAEMRTSYRRTGFAAE